MAQQQKSYDEHMDEMRKERRFGEAKEIIPRVWTAKDLHLTPTDTTYDANPSVAPTIDLKGPTTTSKQMVGILEHDEGSGVPDEIMSGATPDNVRDTRIMLAIGVVLAVSFFSTKEVSSEHINTVAAIVAFVALVKML